MSKIERRVRSEGFSDEHLKSEQVEGLALVLYWTALHDPETRGRYYSEASAASAHSQEPLSARSGRGASTYFSTFARLHGVNRDLFLRWMAAAAREQGTAVESYLIALRGEPNPGDDPVHDRQVRACATVARRGVRAPLAEHELVDQARRIFGIRVLRRR